MQKENNAIEFLFDLTGFTGLDLFLDFDRNNPHEFGKFDATTSSDIEGCLAVWLFYLACIVNLSN